MIVLVAVVISNVATVIGIFEVYSTKVETICVMLVEMILGRF